MGASVVEKLRHDDRDGERNYIFCDRGHIADATAALVPYGRSVRHVRFARHACLIGARRRPSAVGTEATATVDVFKRSLRSALRKGTSRAARGMRLRPREFDSATPM